jgi:hypothetical protein
MYREYFFMRFGIHHYTSTVFFLGFTALLFTVIMPVSAAVMAGNGTVIEQGATIFIGEQGLNVTHGLNQAYYSSTRAGMTPPVGTRLQNNSVPMLTQIGWWASPADLYMTSPSKILDLGTGGMYRTYTIAPMNFVGYTGAWYLLNVAGTRPVGATPDTSLVFFVQDPALDIKVWDFTRNADATGKSVPQGEKLGFRIDTNMYPALDNRYRSNVIDTSFSSGTVWPAIVSYTAGNIRIDSTGTWTNKTDIINIATPTYPLYVAVYNMKYTNYTSSGPLMTWSRGPYGCNRVDSITMYYNRSFNTFVTENSLMMSYPGHTSVQVTPATVWNTSYTYCNQRFPNTATDGYINIVIRDASNKQMSLLYNQSAADTALLPGPYTVLKNYVNTQPFFWGHMLNSRGVQRGNIWFTAARTNSNRFIYPAGTYTVRAESILNKMKDNYPMTAKTVSAIYNMTLFPATDSVGVFRPSTHTFYLKNGTKNTTVTWGTGTDLPVSGDWNRDGLSDVGIFRPSLHRFYLRNGTANTSVTWGLSTADLPVSGDWNKDGLSDVGVFNPSTHRFYLRNGTANTSVNWGLGTDLPVSGDWNGDSLWDVGVFRPSIHTFYLKNRTANTSVSWGLGTDLPVSGDWNGDGLWDVGVFRNSTHRFYLKNGTANTTVNWGLGGDRPVSGRWS